MNDQQAIALKAYEAIPEAAREALRGWVRKEELVAVLKPDAYTFFVVGKSLRGYYSMVTVFKIGDNWAVSADVQDMSADAVFAYLQRRMS